MMTPAHQRRTSTVPLELALPIEVICVRYARTPLGNETPNMLACDQIKKSRSMACRHEAPGELLLKVSPFFVEISQR